MKDKTCLIYQPCGLGDILFLQKVSHIAISNGFKVVHPVIHEYAWLNDYVKNNKLSFPSWGDKANHLIGPPLPDETVFPHKDRYWPSSPDYRDGEFMFLNFFLPFNGPIMASKYNKLGIDYTDWSRYLSMSFSRNHKKENELFYDVLNISDQEEYVFINRNYQMRPEVKVFDRISNDPNEYGNKRVVEMTISEDFTIFDWCRVLEKAKEIHMIETSLNYIIESDLVNLNSEQKKMNLYSRHGWFGEVDYLFKTKWNYMTGVF